MQENNNNKWMKLYMIGTSTLSYTIDENKKKYHKQKLRVKKINQVKKFIAKNQIGECLRED